jgi:hypothetical protein
MQAEEGLHLAHDLAAGGSRLEHLPEEALTGQAQAVDAITAVGALVLGGEQWEGQQIAEVFLELAQSGLAQGLSGAAAQSGQAGAEGWEIRGVQHRAVYIPLY